MPRVTVDQFLFDLPTGWTWLKYDECTYYRSHFNDLASSKAVDLLALAPQRGELWMVEVKDYRRHRRTKPENLFTEVARKVRDTLAGLAAGRLVANDPTSRQFALDAMRTGRLRVAFLLEQPRTPSRLFPQMIDPATAKTALKKAVRAVDPHPFFGSASDLSVKTAWTVTPPRAQTNEH
jgi:hypothetical protein